MNGSNSGEMIETLKLHYNAESHQRKRWLSGVALEFDFSRITIIFAANKPMTDPALNTRIGSFTFPSLSLQQRTKIYESIVRSELPHYVKLFHLTRAQKFEIESRIHAIMPRFVAADQKMFAGVRGGSNVIRDIVGQASELARGGGGVSCIDSDQLLRSAVNQLRTFKVVQEHTEQQQENLPPQGGRFRRRYQL